MIKVRLNRLNIAPRKVRLVANLIKGLSVDEAEKQLIYLNKRAAKPLLKLLKSALNIAEKQKNLKKENLKIKNIIVNEGPKYKRYIPMSRGHVGTIIKRTSHVELELDTKLKNG